MGNFKTLGILRTELGGKKEASLVGEAAFIGPLQKKGILWPQKYKIKKEFI
jgi:hypothetical protein